MEEAYVVRHKVLVEKVPIRRVVREMGIPRNTVRRYVAGTPAGVGKPRPAGQAGPRRGLRARRGDPRRVGNDSTNA